jgi:signal transduction histidine kinase
VDIVGHGDKTLMSVKDNGPGIPASESARIFEPYQIAHDPGSQPSSVGLGLAVARRLARLMDGELSYRRIGHHSVFELQLPRAVTSPEGDMHPARVGDLLSPVVAGVDVP